MADRMLQHKPVNCETAAELLAARIAVEISDQQHQQLALHLTQCSNCRSTELQWQADDRLLNREFGSKKKAARDVAGSVMAKLQAEAVIIPTSAAARKAHSPSLLTPVLAVAVGFLLAAVTFQPWTKARSVVGDGPKNSTAGVFGTTPASAAMAQLVASTGPIRSRASVSSDWVSINKATRFVCEPMTEIETGPDSRCEIVTVDGCVLRLNTDTRLVVETGRRVRVKRGQIWCRSSAELPMEVVVDSGEHAASGDLPVYHCPFGSVCMLKVEEPAMHAEAADGQVTMVTSQGRRVIEAGQSVMISAAGEISAQAATNTALASGWMDSLLVRKGYSDPDLKLRVDALLAEIGESNASLLYERELRSLGEHCVLPLTRYVQSEKSRQAPSRRLKAMTVLADVSPTWNIENLIGLLNDEDGEVRVLAANALQRLTGESHGQASHQWREQPAILDATRDAWTEWWTNNSDRFPPLEMSNPLL